MPATACDTCGKVFLVVPGQPSERVRYGRASAEGTAILDACEKCAMRIDQAIHAVRVKVAKRQRMVNGQVMRGAR